MNAASRSDFKARVTLGRTGLRVSRLGLSASYGVGGNSITRAYEEHGINYLYWGSRRTSSFADGIRRLAERHRDDLVIVVQTYTRLAGLMAPSVHRTLGELGLEHIDLLLLGMFNRPPRPALMDAAQKLRAQGVVRFLAVSCHHRPTFTEYARQGLFDVLMFRYNAAHRGAEREVLPLFDCDDRPGSVAYTATRWGSLLNPSRMPPGVKTPRASDCYRFVLTDPRVDVCLTGPRDDAQLDEALLALERGPISSEERAWMCRVGDHVYRKHSAWD